MPRPNVTPDLRRGYGDTAGEIGSTGIPIAPVVAFGLAAVAFLWLWKKTAKKA